MKEEIINMKKEVQAVKKEEQTLAMELIKETKSQKKMWFIAWLITFLILIGVSCYTIWLYNDIGVVTEETIIQDNKDGYNNYIGNDDELAILRQKETKPQEYEEYFKYCENCKQEVKDEKDKNNI